jgi:pyruvate-formate lyase-activating enzyme
MTQNDMILNHLRTNGSITPLQALDLYGIMRLGARIYDLRRQGEQIYRELVAVKNRRGETTMVAEYVLDTPLE